MPNCDISLKSIKEAEDDGNNDELEAALKKII